MFEIDITSLVIKNNTLEDFSFGGDKQIRGFAKIRKREFMYGVVFLPQINIEVMLFFVESAKAGPTGVLFVALVWW